MNAIPSKRHQHLPRLQAADRAVPVGCNQCFYNRPGAFYADIEQPIMPTLDEVGDGIVRINSGHDSNIGRDKVIRATEQYPRRFFNTSIAKFDFPCGSS